MSSRMLTKRDAAQSLVNENTRQLAREEFRVIFRETVRKLRETRKRIVYGETNAVLPIDLLDSIAISWKLILESSKQR